MGAIADAVMRYAQPLIDKSDGSPEQLKRALSLSQMCWNLAVTPETARDQMLAKLQPSLEMDDSEFQDFKRELVMPMIQRHQEMFPAMHRPKAAAAPKSTPKQATPLPAEVRPEKKYAGTGRNDPCPCGSGKKYKKCCGA